MKCRRFPVLVASVFLLAVSLLQGSFLQATEKPTTLPEEVSQWLADTTEEVLTCLEQDFSGQSRVNRQAVASHPRIQTILRERGALLFDCADFTPQDLKGLFMRHRVRSQPAKSQGQLPSEVNAELAMAAFHTSAGLGEIICRDPEHWLENLEKHFSDVGTHNKRTLE